jgi:hypothetical protein
VRLEIAKRRRASMFLRSRGRKLNADPHDPAAGVLRILDTRPQFNRDDEELTQYLVWGRAAQLNPRADG